MNNIMENLVIAALGFSVVILPIALPTSIIAAAIIVNN